MWNFTLISIYILVRSNKKIISIVWEIKWNEMENKIIQEKGRICFECLTTRECDKRIKKKLTLISMLSTV